MHSTVLRVVVGALAIFAVASGVAYATGSVTSSNDVIQACQVTTSGTLRLVSAPADCRPNETPISWNAQGPQGPPGPSDAPPAPHTQIVGQATVDGLNNGQPFAIRGFSWGATASVDTSGGSGGGAGKAIVEDLTIVHGVDASSPAFVNAAATGEHHRSAVVDLYTPGTTNAYARYTLSDVLVTRVLHAGDEETIALNAADVDETSVAGVQQPTLPSELGTVSFDGIPGTFGVATSRFQVENTGASGGGSGGGAGKAIFAPVKVELAHGSVAPQLAATLLTGRHLRSAVVTMPHATYTLTDVLVSAVHDSATGAAGSVPTEAVELTYAAATVSAR